MGIQWYSNENYGEKNHTTEIPNKIYILNANVKHTHTHSCIHKCNSIHQFYIYCTLQQARIENKSNSVLTIVIKSEWIDTKNNNNSNTNLFCYYQFMTFNLDSILYSEETIPNNQLKLLPQKERKKEKKNKNIYK